MADNLKTLTPEEMASKKSRYEELYTKDEKVLTEAESAELIGLSEELKEIPEVKVENEDTGKEDGQPSPKKKYAGIYETKEDLLKGIASSEAERKRIADELTDEQIKELEDTYKDSQRSVTKLVQKKGHLPTKVPLQDKRLFEMSKEEYGAWEKDNKLEAQSWLSKATALNEAQQKSATKVFDEHPEFFAMMHGVKAPTKEFETYDRLCVDHPEWNRLPNGPELALEEMKKELGNKTPEDKPKPKKSEEKPGFADATGKPKGAAQKAGGKLTAAEFEQLSSDKQREYLENQNT